MVAIRHVVSEPLREPWVGYTVAPEFLGLMARLEADTKQQLENVVPKDELAKGRILLATAWGDPADEILKYADSHHVELVVCGTHGHRGVARLAMGSVAERVVHLASCPVLTVGPGKSVAPAA